jgi:2-amino-4-hydroxy-6-hydroxymethyldihydropteridine diphosphokinase
VGRDAGGPRHGPRVIDIDLLLLEGVQYSSERLTLPHAEVSSRRFVLVPLLELDPELTLPGGERLSDRLLGLPDVEAVRRVAPALV